LSQCNRGGVAHLGNPIFAFLICYSEPGEILSLIALRAKGIINAKQLARVKKTWNIWIVSLRDDVRKEWM